MSTPNVWRTQNRLLMERLEELLHRDMDEIADDEITRLASAAYVLLKQHALNRRGHCRRCRTSWLPKRHKPSTVLQVFGVAMGQPLDVLAEWVRDW